MIFFKNTYIDNRTNPLEFQGHIQAHTVASSVRGGGTGRGAEAGDANAYTCILLVVSGEVVFIDRGKNDAVCRLSVA